jgi:GDP-4-dehydro-6-deoxy-D-mannose reductase
MEHGLQELNLRVGHTGDKRNFTHVKDIVRAYFLAMEGLEPGDLYLVGTERDENIATFAEVIERLIKLSTLKDPIQVEQVAEYTRPTSVPYLLADATKFSELTNWSATYTLDEILADTLNYWRDRVKTNPDL